MPLKINGATSGSVTLAAPATGSDVTLTLPTLGFGKVLQVVSASTTTQAAQTTATWTDTTLSASITPSSTSSKVLVIVFANGLFKAAGANTYGGLRLLRGTNAISTFESQFCYNNTTTSSQMSSGTTVLDSPNSTSSTTYKVQIQNVPATGTVYMNAGFENSTIVLIEVGP